MYILRCHARTSASQPPRLYLACFTPVEATFDPPVALHVAAVFRWSRNWRLTVSSNSFAYWLFHAITFERKSFSKIHESKSKKSLRETSEYRWLLVSMDAEAARAGTDRHTHRTTTKSSKVHVSPRGDKY